jgi:CAP12/Pycsar effector protein, TIR domain
MRIAVFGSWREGDKRDWQLEDPGGFRRAAEMLGRRIVELGHSLVVGTDGADTADYLAASGAAAALGQEASRRVHILAPRGKGSFTQLRRDHPRFFIEQAIPADDWAPAKVFQVRYADAILILAGAKASRQAGLTAAVSGKRLVCLGSFGGAARGLNELFMQSRASWGTSLPDSETLGALQSPWSDVLVDDVLSALGADGKPKILIIHGRAHDRDTLKSYLRDALHLPEPTVLVDEKTPSHLIPDKFEELASKVDGAIALCTPDDVGSLAESKPPNAGEFRARQNVWLEIGWFWGRLGLRRVLVLTRGEISVPSDLDGIERYKYADQPHERADEIKAFLANIGRGSV